MSDGTTGKLGQQRVGQARYHRGQTDDERNTLINHYGNFIVTARMDGDYDKRGLSDPLVLAFYVTPKSGLIVQLIVLRNRSNI
jgi:hypothetical protein